MVWEKVAEKVKRLIIERKPSSLTLSVYQGEVYVYVDGMLEFREQIEKQEGEKPRVKTESEAKEGKKSRVKKGKS